MKLNSMDFSQGVVTGGIPLPSLPAEEKLQVSAVPTEVPSASPIPVNTPSLSPVQTASPSSETISDISSPSPSVAPSPNSVAAVPGSTDEILSVVNSSGFQEIKDSSTHSDAPVINIDGGLIPEVITINNVVNITGRITCSPGVLEEIRAEIIQNDKSVQSASFFPMLDVMSLAGTVNADLHFAQLGVGDYIYRITATAVNGDDKSTFTLVDESFSVVAAGSSKSDIPNGGAGGYVARTSSGTDTADLIWNFLIGQFDNPYAAAGIMANMEAESSLNPKSSQGEGDACGYGLCQWTQARKQNLKDFAYIVSTDISDLDLQLCFLMYELENDYPKLKEFLMNVTDGYLAASEFCAIYEQSASPGRRCELAKKYLDRYALPG